MKMTFKLAKLTVLLVACASLAGCDDVRVYGSVGYSGYMGGLVSAYGPCAHRDLLKPGGV